ncbi:SAM-dependent methyltransferase [Micromonospora sp. DT48]|uniref:SAM-dependent methyltransferase n=1 Tax=Micromonospora sp. DT48 TaxID=3393429 RepID=UPI003CE91D4C
MVEPEQPSTARMIDFWLGGAHHHPVDVAAAHAFEQAYGPCAPVFRELRAFLGRAVRAIAATGVDGFLVFGAGVPTMGNVHEVAMMGPTFRMRPPAACVPLLGRWTPTPDGIVPVPHWRPEGEPAQVPDAFHGAVAVRSAG